jgi:hypothetical protein
MAGTQRFRRPGNGLQWDFAMGVAEEVIQGNRSDPNSVFWWDQVLLNLPGIADNDHSMPWVYKLCLDDGRIAADLFIFVDDLQPTGPS